MRRNITSWETCFSALENYFDDFFPKIQFRSRSLPKRTYFEVLKFLGTKFYMYFSTIYVVIKFREKPIHLVACVKNEILSCENLNFSAEICLFTHVTRQVNFSWNYFVDVYHVKMYAQIFVSKFWTFLNMSKMHFKIKRAYALKSHEPMTPLPFFSSGISRLKSCDQILAEETDNLSQLQSGYRDQRWRFFPRPKPKWIPGREINTPSALPSSPPQSLSNQSLICVNA
jgi:hypothetical protein